MSQIAGIFLFLDCFQDILSGFFFFFCLSKICKLPSDKPTKLKYRLKDYAT